MMVEHEHNYMVRNPELMKLTKRKFGAVLSRGYLLVCVFIFVCFVFRILFFPMAISTWEIRVTFTGGKTSCDIVVLPCLI